MISLQALLLPLLLASSSSCVGSGLGSIAKTNDLEPGMNTSEVEEVLGSPSQTQFIGNKWIWKYSLHEYWKGYVPYYLAFGSDSKRLESWYADEAEYMRQQQLWMQAFPPTQTLEVDLTIKPASPYVPQ